MMEGEMHYFSLNVRERGGVALKMEEVLTIYDANFVVPGSAEMGSYGGHSLTGEGVTPVWVHSEHPSAAC